jgi:uncharacterized protein YeaO (DUF488 family)
MAGHQRDARRSGITTKSVRAPVSPDDGARILVDRLWPRGVSKERAAVTEWRRDLSPSTELRRWFGHDPSRWDDFRLRYRRELAASGAAAALDELRRRSRRERITLLFGAGDVERNNAVALQEFVRAKGIV